MHGENMKLSFTYLLMFAYTSKKKTLGGLFITLNLLKPTGHVMHQQV